MTIVPIFVEGTEGLHSMQYPKESDCEYYRLFEIWYDYEYLLNFCKQNKDLIFNDFWAINRLEEFVEMIIEEAYKLEDMFIDFDNVGLARNSSFLQSIFIPLDYREKTVPALQESKAKADVRKPKLRLYAIRVDKNTFILTGGCIKLTLKMDENAYTVRELEKLQIVKEFLQSHQLFNQDDLACYYE